MAASLNEEEKKYLLMGILDCQRKLRLGSLIADN